MSIVGYQSCLNYKYKLAIEPVWDSAPISSSPIEIEEVNDIIFGFNGDELTMIDGAELNKRERVWGQGEGVEGVGSDLVFGVQSARVWH